MLLERAFLLERCLPRDADPVLHLHREKTVTDSHMEGAPRSNILEESWGITLQFGLHSSQRYKGLRKRMDRNRESRQML